MSESHLQHRTGVALVIAAAVAWSTAPFFTRLLHFDSWTILFWRGLFGGGFITLFLILTQGRAGIRSLIGMKGNGWLVACLSTLGMVTFIPALQLTSVANVAIIIAVQPFAAAAIAWIWLRETVQLRTLVASLVALVGVAIIVSGA
jgi:drug/metabolite transporter (DMT)-like permease